MSLYYEAADVLTAPTSAGGSLKSKIFSNKNLKSQPAQIYALVIETYKWSFLLKEIIERASLLNLERKLTPVLSLLLVHDLLRAKRGIALPATHGLRTAVERHKARLQAEYTKARLRRNLGTVDALKEYVDSGQESSSSEELPYPRWIRINTIKTQLEDQLETTFADYERVPSVNEVRQRGSSRIYIDIHIPNLIAVSPSVDLVKNEAYISGALIFQDKASCFPAYLLDPMPEDGNVIDTCAAPGNKTTHLASILLSHTNDCEDFNQTIYAFEKNRARAEILKKMLNMADSQKFSRVHAGQDFLKIDPNDPSYQNVGALLLDPSCSGSGIVGRDDMPQLQLPSQRTEMPPPNRKGKSKPPKNDTEKGKEILKRKRDIVSEEPLDIIDDDGVLEPIISESELQKRLDALSAFQLSLLQHAMTFPAAKKITYSTCSIHAAENENVVLKALASKIARERGWRILKRKDQVRGMREWPVRGDVDACSGDEVVQDGCIRANKGDEFATMGFFLAGFVRDDANQSRAAEPAGVMRDQRGFIVRDLMGMPVLALPGNGDDAEEDEWNGFEDDVREMSDADVVGEGLTLSLSESFDEVLNTQKTHAVGADESRKKVRRKPK